MNTSSELNNEWDGHWSEFDSSATINPAQAYRRRLVIKMLFMGKHKRIADLGCGMGDLLKSFKEKAEFSELLGVDYSDQALFFASENVPGLRAWKANIDSKMEPPKELVGWADVITCTEVLEHLDQPEFALGIAHRLLSSGGRLIVTVPSGPMSSYDKYIGHKQHFKAEKMYSLLHGIGFQDITVFKAGFPFFNLYRLVVIARGEKLISDAGGKKMSFLGRIAIFIFAILFKFNIINSPWGWQLIAVASRK